MSSSFTPRARAHAERRERGRGTTEHKTRRRGSSVEGDAEKCRCGGVAEEAGGGQRRQRHGQPTRKKRAGGLLELGDAPPLLLVELERHAPLCLLRRRPEEEERLQASRPHTANVRKRVRHFPCRSARRWQSVGAAFPAQLAVAPLVGLSVAPRIGQKRSLARSYLHLALSPPFTAAASASGRCERPMRAADAD